MHWCELHLSCTTTCKVVVHWCELAPNRKFAMEKLLFHANRRHAVLVAQPEGLCSAKKSTRAQPNRRLGCASYINGLAPYGARPCIYKQTNPEGVGLRTYLRPRIYILGHAKKRNNTQHYVLCVVLRLTQQAHKLQPFGLQRNIAIAHHNRPKGRLWYVYHNLSGYGTRFKIIIGGIGFTQQAQALQAHTTLTQQAQAQLHTTATTHQYNCCTHITALVAV